MSGMSPKTFEELIKIARKYQVDSFVYGDTTVNLGPDTSQYSGVDPSESAPRFVADDTFDRDGGADYLLNNPTIGGL